MKKIKLMLLMLCVLLMFKAQAAHQLYADIDGISLPYGTKLELKMAQNVTASQVMQGDIFQAYLVKDIYINRKLVLPANTTFRGRVSGVKYSRSLSRPAILYLTLDHLITKKGYQLPIHSGISSDFEYVLKKDGAITTNGNYFKAVKADAKKAGQIVPRTIKWGATSGDNLFTGARYIFIPVSALGGIIACGCSTIYNTIADLFRHGDDVIIKQNAPFDIILLSELEIPS